MKDSHSPQSWVAPDWHAEFGDSKSELEHLRSLAMAVLVTVARSAVTLEIPEPGLMYLSISMPDGTVTEVHSVTGTQRVERRFGIFPRADTPGEEELYADSLDEAIRLIGVHQA